MCTALLTCHIKNVEKGGKGILVCAITISPWFWCPIWALYLVNLHINKTSMMELKAKSILLGDTCNLIIYLQ